MAAVGDGGAPTVAAPPPVAAASAVDVSAAALGVVIPQTPTAPTVKEPSPATTGGAAAVGVAAAPAAAAATFPAEYYCPISNVIMRDPVSTMDGDVFERAAIERWLKRQCTNPLTGAALPAPTLVPNNVLARLIKASGALADAPTGATAPVTAPSPAVVPLTKPVLPAQQPSSVVRSGSPAVAAAPRKGAAVTPAAANPAAAAAAAADDQPPPHKKTREQELEEWKLKKRQQQQQRQQPPHSGKGGGAKPRGASPAAAPPPVVAVSLAQPDMHAATPLQPIRAERANINASAPNPSSGAAKGPVKRPSGAMREVVAPPTAPPSGAGKGAVGDGVDLMQLLRSHNAKVRSEMVSKPAYEPRAVGRGHARVGEAHGAQVRRPRRGRPLASKPGDQRVQGRTG